MKKLEKYKIACEICKIQGEAFCGNTNNSSWKSSPPLLDCLKSSRPWMCPHPGSLSLAVSPLPGWRHKNHSPPIPGGGHYVPSGNYDNFLQICRKLSKSFSRPYFLVILESLFVFSSNMGLAKNHLIIYLSFSLKSKFLGEEATTKGVL